MRHGIIAALEPKGVLMRAVIVVVLSCAAMAGSAFGQARVIITEIMYNPASKETRNETEWVEIANVGDKSIEIKGWRLDDEDDRRGDDWGPFSCRLEPGGIAVLINEDAASEEQFRKAWDGDSSDGGSAHYHVIPVKWGSLSNNPTPENEILQLLDETGKVICEVNFESGGEWPRLTPKGGPSIWLTDLHAADLNDGKLWKKSEAGKDGARRSVKTDVFDGEDIGSPGFVPGLKSPATASPRKPGERESGGSSPSPVERPEEKPIDY